MPTTTIRSHTDAWIDQSAQYQSHGKTPRLYVRSTDSSLGRRSFIAFAKPFPHNDALDVVEATLKLYVRDADKWAGSTTIKVRRVTSSWKENRVNWNNQPDVGTTDSEVTVVDPDANDLVEIDVTDRLQAVAAGGYWYGLRVASDRDVKLSFWSSDSSREEYHPRLYVRWALGPFPPTNGHPRGDGVISTATPTFTWRFTDHDKEATQTHSQLQISTSRDTFAADVVYDSADDPDADGDWQANTAHHWDITGRYTIADGVTRYWRVRVKDDSGLESQWSNIWKFERQTKPSLVITDPGGDEVNDLTPTIMWLYGGTQKRVRMLVEEIKANGQREEVFEHKDKTHPNNHLTIWTRRKKPIIRRGHEYLLHLYVWDGRDRVDTPRDSSFSYASKQFHYERDGRPDPPTSLSVNVYGPGITFTVERASAPDWWCVSIDDEEVWTWIDPDDYLIDTNTWRFTYWGATPRKSVKVEVEAVDTISGVRAHSINNPTETVTTNPIGIWFIDEDDDRAVVLWGDEDADMVISELATTYKRIANRVPVRIRDSLQGFEGTLPGRVDGDSARDTLIDLKANSPIVRMVAANFSFPVFFEDVGISPTPIPGGDQYTASVAVSQVDEFLDEP